MSIKIVKGSYSTILDATSLSGNHTVSFPDSSGTVALTDQLATVATSGSYNDLTDKPNIPESQAGYITQTWQNGNNWYRKWSDGWIEQGGRSGSKTIALNIAFSNTSYTAMGNGVLNTNNNSYDTFFIKSLSTTYIYASQANTSTNYWVAFGF